MRQTPLQLLLTERLGRPLAEFVAERHQKYVPGSGWRQLAADLYEATGIEVSHETLRAWFSGRESAA